MTRRLLQSIWLIGVLFWSCAVGATTVAVTQVQMAASGNQDITTTDLGGLTPKAAIIWTAGSEAADTDEDSANFGVWFADGTRECGSHHWGAQGAARFNEQARTLNTNEVLEQNDLTVTTAPESTSVTGRATFNSFITNGIRITIATATDRPYINVMLIAGSDVSAYCNNHQMPSGGSHSVTGVGFRPKMLFGLSGRAHNTLDTAVIGDTFSMGVAAGSGSSTVDAQVYRTYGHSYDSVDLAANTSVGSGNWLDNYQAVGDVAPSGQTVVTLDSFDTDGFSYTTTGNFQQAYIAYLALTFDDDAWVGVVDTPTATGDWTVTSPGITPKVVGLLTTKQTATGRAEGTAQESIGFSAWDANDGVSASIVYEDGATAVNSNRRTTLDHVFLYDETTPSIALESNETGDPMTSTGWALSFGTVPGSAYKAAAFAIGSGTPAGTIDDATWTVGQLNIAYTCTTAFTGTITGITSPDGTTISADAGANTCTATFDVWGYADFLDVGIADTVDPDGGTYQVTDGTDNVNVTVDSISPTQTAGPTFWSYAAGAPTYPADSVHLDFTPNTTTSDPVWGEVDSGTIDTWNDSGAIGWDTSTGNVNVKFFDKSLATPEWTAEVDVDYVADTTAPTLSTATIGPTGEGVVLVFDEAVAIGAGGSGGFVADMTNGAVALTYVSGDTTTTLSFSTSRVINEDETGDLDYTQPGNGIEDVTAGNDLATISNGTLTNNSTINPCPAVVRDAILSAILDPMGEPALCAP